MIVLTTLGVLGIYFGGTVIFPGTPDPPISFTNEWSGLLGGFRWIRSHPWMVFSPVIFISLTVVSFKMMAMGLEKEMESNKVVYKGEQKVA